MSFLSLVFNGVSGKHVSEDELSAQAAQRTPADRLTLLLESLREYCTDEQFDSLLCGGL
jgi:hypothetical protein